MSTERRKAEGLFKLCSSAQLLALNVCPAMHDDRHVSFFTLSLLLRSSCIRIVVNAELHYAINSSRAQMQRITIMKNVSLCVTSIALAASMAAFPEIAQAGGCRSIRADLIEVRSTSGCKPGETSCFLGEVDGNYGFNGTTHFRTDSVGAKPSTALPGFISYSGLFEYETSRGMIFTREQGVSNAGTGQPQSGAVTAYQQILSGTGRFEGATGFFFVSGRNVNNVITTKVTGSLCLVDDDDHDDD